MNICDILPHSLFVICVMPKKIIENTAPISNNTGPKSKWTPDAEELSIYDHSITVCFYFICHVGWRFCPIENSIKYGMKISDSVEWDFIWMIYHISKWRETRYLLFQNTLATLFSFQYDSSMNSGKEFFSIRFSLTPLKLKQTS